MAIYLLRCAQDKLEAAAGDLSLAAALVPESRPGGEVRVLADAVERMAEAVEAVIGRQRRDAGTPREPSLGPDWLPLEPNLCRLAMYLLRCAVDELGGAGADLSLAGLLIRDEPAGNDAGLLADAVGREAGRLVGVIGRWRAERA